MRVGTTLAFRRFKRKHTELNQIYWTHVLGADCVRKGLQGKDLNDAVTKLLDTSVAAAQMPLTGSKTLEWLELYMDRIRLNLLVVCSAHLESYLHEACFLKVSDMGHHTPNFVELDEAGKAIASPIVDRASLPIPLRYSEYFFDVDFGNHLDNWLLGYKLRCAMAHNGGVVTPRTIVDLRKFKVKLKLDDQLKLDWEGLKSFLDSCFKIASMVDKKIASESVFFIETMREVYHLKKIKKLPKKDDFWEFMFSEYGILLLKTTKKKVDNAIFH